MSLINLFLSILFPWSLLYGIRYLRVRYWPSTSSLPLTLNPRHAIKRRQVFYDHISWSSSTLDIGLLWLKYETKRWNSLFAPSFVFAFGGETNAASSHTLRARLRKALHVFYTVGAAVSIGLLTVGMVLLTWSAFGVIWRMLAWLGRGDTQKKGLHKRDSPLPQTESDGAGLHALIPGVTVPLSDLPIILLVLCLTGVVHEIGHGITATLESVRVTSTGFHLHIAIPTFFVSLSPSSVGTLPNAARLRIATAGAWHNIITWGVLVLFGSSTLSAILGMFPFASFSTNSSNSPFGEDNCKPTSDCTKPPTIPSAWDQSRPSRIWSLLGYRNMQLRGLVVVDVSLDSPLVDYIPVGSVVTKIDDLRLGGTGLVGQSSPTGMHRWYSHLTRSVEQEVKGIQEDSGWCVPESWYHQQPTACCSAATANSTGSCFSTREAATVTNTTARRCLDPLPLFTYQHRLSRGQEGSNPSAINTTATSSAYGARCHVVCLRPDGDSTTYACVRPHINPTLDASEWLLRIEFEEPPWMRSTSRSSSVPDSITNHFAGPNEVKTLPRIPTRLIVYKGPTVDVLNQVTVGYLQPRTYLFPPISLPNLMRVHLPLMFGRFLDYTARLSLSLAFFNLLPVQGLDGGVVLACVLHWLLIGRDGTRPGEEFDIEMLEQGESPRSRVRRNAVWDEAKVGKLERITSWTCLGLGALVVLATVWKDVT
ncbi:hypothetical protein PIIN_01956 [Serendipita indica DSM 11827]|uniref:Endopeptidase S2P n=1 Tax=Serendipita indica (strain DSM 11827) TaxID=1109443 RepID=G4T9T5_SERID|nr:hypothetical protein PIIN_01956 [Serendipita indica DSM 11827]